MKKIMSLISAVLVMFAFSSPITSIAKSAEFFTIGTGGPTGVYFQTGNAICKMLHKSAISADHGRKKGIWWKYKVDPMQLDAVLIYAKGGSGRRAGLYTDYSFALWKDQELIKFASAYSGLTNIEIKELDKWIRKNTIEKFGPVRSLKPEMVFEISFEKIQISKRHKSGIAVRFPRITKWRKEKKIYEADSLDNAYELMKKIS